jgi:hypothetical protein
MKLKTSPLAGLRASIVKVNRAVEAHREASAELRAVVASCPRPEDLTTTGEHACAKEEEERSNT